MSALETPARARPLTAELLELCRGSRPGDARAFLDQHPELEADESLVRDLAWEEYCQRVQAGEFLDPQEFCARFPGCRRALLKLLAAEGFLDDHPQYWSAPEPTPWPAPGEVFLGFELVRELGRGSFSRVFLARQQAVASRWVAVKVTVLGGTEAATLGRLPHRNVVPVHAAAVDDETGLAAVCMPFLGGATLADVCDRVADAPTLPTRGRFILEAVDQAAPPAPEMPPPDTGRPDPVLLGGDYVRGVLHLAAQLADALAFVHASHVCHRDLKPSNVLVTPAGRPMLLDFNLSADPVADNRWFGGTLEYMPPEQLRATGPNAPAQSDVGPPADLYALGVIVYELLAGKHPFGPPPQGDGTEEPRAAFLERQGRGPAPLRAANPSVPAAVAALVERCLAFDAADRPASAAEVARLLRRAVCPWRRAGRLFTGTGLRLVLLLAAGVANAGGMAGGDHDTRAHLERGQRALAAGDNRLAITYLSRALQADPNLYGAHVLRGWASLRLGDFGAALADFEKADALVEDGRTRACRAYCLSQLDHDRDAIEHYQRAVEAGFATAEVYNNLGYSYLQTVRKREDLSPAWKKLNEALRQNPRLQAARYNRALVDCRAATWDEHHFPEAGIEDIECALELGPPTADLYHWAARLYGLAAPRRTGVERQRLEGKARAAVARALELGQGPCDFAGDGPLLALPGIPQLLGPADQPRRLVPPGQTTRCLNPCPDLAD